MFLTRSGEILVNEIAPRPPTVVTKQSKAILLRQYEQHLRAIPWSSVRFHKITRPSVMVNLLEKKAMEMLSMKV